MSLGLNSGSVHNKIRSVKGAPPHFCEDLIQIGARGAGPPDHEAVAFLEKFCRVKRVPGTEYKAERARNGLCQPLVFCWVGTLDSVPGSPARLPGHLFTGCTSGLAVREPSQGRARERETQQGTPFLLSAFSSSFLSFLPSPFPLNLAPPG